MRKTISKAVQVRIWKRDNWTCQYCGVPVFFAPTLKLLNELSPNHGYYHPNGKADKILDLFQWRWASIDHITPVTRNGENNEDNYLTACWKCNLIFNNSPASKKSTRLGKNNKNTAAVNWDGLSSLYPILNRKNDEWAKLLRQTEFGVKSNLEMEDYLEGLKNLRKHW